MSPLPLIFCAVCWLGGLLVSSQQPTVIWFFLLVAALGAGWLKRSLRSGAILVAIVALAALHISLNRQLPGRHVTALFTAKEEILQPISGTISGEVVLRDGRWLTRINQLTVCGVAVSGAALFSTTKPGLHYGDRVSCIMQLSAIRPPGNPGMMNWQKWYGRRGIFARGYPRSAVTVQPASGFSLQRSIIDLRRWMLRRIRQRFGEDAPLISAVLLGCKDELGDTRTLFTQAGLSHLLAISGLHVGVLFLIITGITSILPQRTFRKLLTIALLMLYCLLCNGIPSVFRATTMLSLYLLASLFSRKVSAPNILAAAFLVITILRPEDIYSVGLQMSFIAVATLLFFLPRIRPCRITKSDNGLKLAAKKSANNLIGIVGVSFWVSLYLSPITMHYFYQFNLNGIIANMLAIPLFSLLLVLSVICLAVPPPLYQLYYPVFLVVHQVLNRWVALCAGMPFCWKPLFASGMQVIVLFGLLILGGVLQKRRHRAMLIGVVLALVAVVALPYMVPSKHERVVFFDCGLGDCALIQQGETAVLIDTGPVEDEPGHATRTILPFLIRQRITNLDLVILTHGHNDHFGGFDALAKELNIQRVAVTDEFKTRSCWPRIQRTIVEENAEVTTVTDTTTIVVGDLRLKVLHPDAGYNHPKINNASIVVRVVLQSTVFLFCGDAEEEVEEHLLSRYPKMLNCDVLKVGHHGSKTSSTMAFIQGTSPEVAIVSTSRHNRFSFPHPATMRRYAQAGVPCYITGKDGCIIFEKSQAKPTTRE